MGVKIVIKGEPSSSRAVKTFWLSKIRVMLYVIVGGIMSGDLRNMVTPGNWFNCSGSLTTSGVAAVGCSETYSAAFSMILKLVIKVPPRWMGVGGWVLLKSV